MSQELYNLRKNVSQVSGLLKQLKLLPAVQYTLVAANALATSTNLMRAEQEELNQLLIKAGDALDNDKEIRKYFPLSLEYKNNDLKKFISTLNELIGILKVETTKEISGIAKVIAKKKQALDKGQEELNSGDIDEARNTFSSISEEFTEDAQLASDIGDRFLQSGLFEDATKYLEKSSGLNPGSAHVFNRLAISLRKLKRYEAAEKNFFKALEIEKQDPNLYFNLGRLYLDWEKWNDVIAHAEKAAELDPEFEQAIKLVAYAKRIKQDS